MSSRTWSQMAGNETANPLPVPEPIAGSSKIVNDSEKTVSLNDIMSEQLAVELQGNDDVQTKLSLLDGLENDLNGVALDDYRKEFLREAGLIDYDVEDETKRFVFFFP